MFLKALIKTLTPSKEAVFAVVFFILGIIIVSAILTRVVIGLSAALVYLFGEKITTAIFVIVVVSVWTWVLIIEPLVDRYKRIKWQLEQGE